jgi:hypothetical protein
MRRGNVIIGHGLFQVREKSIPFVARPFLYPFSRTFAFIKHLFMEFHARAARHPAHKNRVFVGFPAPELVVYMRNTEPGNPELGLQSVQNVEQSNGITPPAHRNAYAARRRAMPFKKLRNSYGKVLVQHNKQNTGRGLEGKNSASAEIRTPDKWIMIPLL